MDLDRAWDALVYGGWPSGLYKQIAPYLAAADPKHPDALAYEDALKNQTGIFAHPEDPEPDMVGKYTWTYSTGEVEAHTVDGLFTPFEKVPDALVVPHAKRRVCDYLDCSHYVYGGNTSCEQHGGEASPYK